MVAPGTGSCKELETAIGAVCGFDDNVFKLIETDESGAGAGDEGSSWVQEAHSQLVQVFVFAIAFKLLFAIFNEFRWIQENDVPFFAVGLHLTGVGVGICVDPVYVTFAVDVGIALGLGDGVFVQIYAGNVGRVSQTGCHDGEATGVAAEIQYAFAFYYVGEAETVVALIAEEAGFVSFGEVNFKVDAVFDDFDGVVFEFWRGNMADSFHLLDAFVYLDEFVLGSQP